MKMWKSITLFILILIIAGLGISRVRFQTELTSVLPADLPPVEAVKTFHQYFDDDHQIIILLRAPGDKVYSEDISDLTTYLESKLPNATALHDSAFDREPLLFAQEVARTWALSNPQTLEHFTEKTSNLGQLSASLTTLKEEIKSSFRTGTAIKRSYDPIGFMNHPGLEELAKSDYSFESDDGNTRFFFLKKSSTTSGGYQDDAQWVSDVRQAIEAWNEENDNLFTYGLTGGPVYNSEVGAGMEKDLLGTVSITLLLISLLFLLIQRSISQLLVLIGAVALTFFITLGVAGWLMPHLNMLSISFAAILLGLIIDYAVVLLREGKLLTKDRHVVRHELKNSILWAAFTTILVFSILLLSSFPAVKQLGYLILIGLITGAIVMLWLVPKYLERSRSPLQKITPQNPRHSLHLLWIPTLILASGIYILSSLGTPQFSFSLESIQPKTSEAAKVQTELSRTFSSWSELRTVVFAKADSAPALEKAVTQANRAAKKLEKEGFISEIQLPAEMVPYPIHYAENIVKLRKIGQQWSDLEHSATEAGFSEEALKFGQAVIDEINSLPNHLSQFNAIPRPFPLTKGMLATHEGTHYFRGNIVLTKPLSGQDMAAFSGLNTDTVTMTGWGPLSAILEPLVKSDFRKIFLPATGVILLGLGLVFRRWKDTLLVIGVLTTSLITINAYMVLSNTSWNFLNCIAFPLIIGIGIDYSIHLIFSLRRQQETGSSLWKGVGLAILFCGLSSVIGFGSLTLATNDMLKSLGQICATGVLITMILTLMVIPPLWEKWSRK